MYDVFYSMLQGFGWTAELANIISYMFTFLVTAIICYVVHIIAEAVVKRVAEKVTNNKHVWVEIFFKHKFFHHAANTLIPITIVLLEQELPSDSTVVNGLLLKSAAAVGVIVSVFLFNSLLNAIDEVYLLHEISKVKPMRSLFQVMKTTIIIVCVIIGAAELAGRNPLNLIGGIGAIAAVTSFIFKDAILGFVSGLQLISNDLIRINDWIEMPKHNANGTVVELSMTSVKVENFDGSFTSIPAYALISDSFINWRGIQDSGSRRIKHAMYIDVRDIKFIDGENDAARETNLGKFREYALEYLKKHPNIRHDMPTLVRQINSEGHGISLEIYAFSNTHIFEEYELIQSTIFEHLHAVIQDFGLRAYQWPTVQD